MSPTHTPNPALSVTGTSVDFLRHAVTVYEAAIKGDWHNQSKDFHRAVLNDAKWVLGDRTVTPSGHVRDVRSACREVCSELHIICLSRRREKGGRVSGLAARKHAAELLGIEYKSLTKILRHA
jgi:hypothetical protein